jgi:prolipoprotein diacylglyceryltransferase
LLALFVIWKKTSEEHFEEDEVVDTILATGLWALVGARVIYILFHLDQFGLNLIWWLNWLGKPGFAFLGGLLGGVAAIYFQTKKRKWDFYKFIDLVTAGLALMLVFGWLGSFLNGSNFGLPTESIVGVRFVGMFDKRLPVQLFASGLYLLLFGYLVWVEGKYRTFDWYRAGKSGVRPGFLVFSFTMVMGAIELLVAWLSPPDLVVAGVGWDRWFWIIFVLLGAGGLYWRSGRELARDLKNIFPGRKPKPAAIK